MQSQIKIIIIVIVGFILASIAINYFIKPPVDWSISYNTKDKIPLGLYVLDHEIDSFYQNYVDRPKSEEEEYDLNMYLSDGISYQNTETMLDDDEESDLELFHWIFINNVMERTSEGVTTLLNAASYGNTIFISATDLPDSLQTALGFEVVTIPGNPTNFTTEDTVEVSLTDTLGKNVAISHNKGISGSFFMEIDSSKTEILGYVKKASYTEANFIRVAHGNGWFYIHLEPAVFCNFFLLQKNYEGYAHRALAYLQHAEYYIWSQHQQSSRVISDSPVRFVMSQPPLKWAWYLLLGGLVLFVVFNIRRNQRIIPSLPKNVNTTVDFTRTIGNLYQLEGDIRHIMDQKIIYTLEKIRSDYYINTETLDAEFEHLLHLKSNKNKGIIKKMVFLIEKHRSTDYVCTEDDLRRLNTAIEDFNQSSIK